MKDLSKYVIIHCPDCEGKGFVWVCIGRGYEFKGSRFQAHCNTCEGAGMIIRVRKRRRERDNRRLELSQ